VLGLTIKNIIKTPTIKQKNEMINITVRWYKVIGTTPYRMDR